MLPVSYKNYSPSNPNRWIRTVEALDIFYAFTESKHDTEARASRILEKKINGGGPGIFNALGKVMNGIFSFVSEVISSAFF